MTDLELYAEITKPYKNSAIAEYLGITLQGYLNKKNGKTTFKQKEIKELAEFLRLTDEEVLRIFFAEDVEKR